MPPSRQKYHIRYPLTATQVINIDEMFQDLYSKLGVIDSDISSQLEDILNAALITWGSETGTFPNSRVLVAGTNITFDDSQANQRIINATGGASFTLLTNGDLIEPELVFAGGDVILVPIP